MGMPRPALTAVSLQLQRPIQRRAFSRAPARWTKPRAPQPPVPHQAPHKSIRVAQKEVTTLPQDLGLLPKTFIQPTGTRNPSLLRHPLVAAQFQWARLLAKARDLVSLVTYRLTYRKHVRLRRRQIAPAATALHHRMYTALAEGDMSTLRKICADGLAERFAARIAVKRRKRDGETARWELVRYTRRPRIMSHRGAWLGVEGAGVRQAVVRIASVQKLTRFRADGSVVPGSGEERELVEYIVVQKNLVNSMESREWIVWGTIEDTTVETLEEWKAVEELA